MKPGSSKLTWSDDSSCWRWRSISACESAGRRAFQLTDAGRAYLEENREALGIPWEAVGGDVPEGLFQLRQLMMQLGMATMQVAQAGDEAQTAEARKVLEEARRALYRILAGDAGDEPTAD